MRCLALFRYELEIGSLSRRQAVPWQLPGDLLEQAKQGSIGSHVTLEEVVFK